MAEQWSNSPDASLFYATEAMQFCTEAVSRRLAEGRPVQWLARQEAITSVELARALKAAAARRVG